MSEKELAEMVLDKIKQSTSSDTEELQELCNLVFKKFKNVPALQMSSEDLRMYALAQKHTKGA